MKILVNGIQLLVILALIYPFFIFWEKSNVDEFCEKAKVGTHQQQLQQIADEMHVKLIPPSEKDKRGYWTAYGVTHSPISSYSCQLRGLGNKVAEARIEEASE